MKKILEDNNLLYVTNGEVVRIIHLKTGDAKETTNPSMIQKVLDKGEEVPTSNSRY